MEENKDLQINAENVITDTEPKATIIKEKRRFSFATVVISFILSLAVGLGAGISSANIYLRNHKDDNPQNSKPTDVHNSSDVSPSYKENVDKEITIIETSESVVSAVAEKAGPSVVGIRTTVSAGNFLGGNEETSGEGSGVIYRSDGYIITNYHVIENAVNSSSTAISVYLPSDTKTAIPATLVGYSISSDLAVIKINITGLPAIEIANSDEIKVGQFAIAIGNPGGLEFMGSVTYGIVSGVNRTVTVEGIGQMSLIQTDAAINPGNSGGALVDTKGKLIGLNSNKLVSTRYEGMGFAIPSNKVVEICEKIISNENTPTPYVGIVVSTSYDEDTLKYLGYPTGAVVQSVAEGSPAFESGIRRGDIITQFNGSEIKNYQAFTEAVNKSKPGDIVSIHFYRAGRYYSTSLAIGANNAQ